MAIRMIEADKMSLEDIADYTELPIEVVNELVNQIRQLV